MVMVLGTSACHMLNARPEDARTVPGVCGIVEGGIVEGLVGYECGQSAFGDMFGWLAKFCSAGAGAGAGAGDSDAEQLALLQELSREALSSVPPGSGGVMVVDHFNGCRTPFMDTALKGSISGLTLSTTPAQV
jgi:L-ribulokinase